MNNRPYVILNVAMTADGKTDTAARRGASISSSYDMERVDRLRAQCDAIMVGGRTLLGDDPRLTIKSEALRAERVGRGLEENPIKIGVVTDAAIRPDSRFLTAGPARIFIFSTCQTDAATLARLSAQGAKLFVTEGTRVDLKGALRRLKQLGVERLLVEGGGTLNEALLKDDLVDEISIYVAPLIFGGATAPTFVSGAGMDRDAAIPLNLTTIEKYTDGGFVLHYAVQSMKSNPDHIIKHGE